MSVHDHCSHRAEGSFFTSPVGRAVIGFLVIAGVLLFTGHRAHVLDILIYGRSSFVRSYTSSCMAGTVGM